MILQGSDGIIAGMIAVLQRYFWLGMVLVLAGCAGGPAPTEMISPNAYGYRTATAEQCVPYARRLSGIEIYGDAYTWWDRSMPGYARGQVPRSGAVLVLSRTQKMHSGHVAVVRDVLDARSINVTHSNWGNDPASRRVVYESMRVEDISANNDWTRVRFWNAENQCFGFPYAARGFIYP